MNDKTAIVWFRQDLRVFDNPALNFAAENSYKILPIYILDDENAGEWKIGEASRWWLQQSLQTLNLSLNQTLQFFNGPSDLLIKNILIKYPEDIKAVFWNDCYEPWRRNCDKNIFEFLQSQGVFVKNFNGSLLWEPSNILTKNATPYKVFTPFYRKGCLKSTVQPPRPLPAPPVIKFSKISFGTKIDDLCLLSKHKWYNKFENIWKPGEQGAKSRLEDFLSNGLKGYAKNRNRPDFEGISRLSPYLHFGEISVNTVWHNIQNYGLTYQLEHEVDIFCSELGWREFSNNLLYFNPTLPEKPIQTKYSLFPWMKGDYGPALEAWKKGVTGIPIVDAGMRQLWKTGWMHNRVRMIAASFLVKNLLIHWHEGQRWFWDTLIDADLANNSASWQWVAGCGADAMPYFRIFNPITQGEKFDPDGNYVRYYVPELKNLPPKFIHRPWDTPATILKSAGAEHYPAPIVDLSLSRQRALESYKILKGLSS